MKKILGLILVLTMSMFLFAGCGDDDTSADVDTNVDTNVDTYEDTYEDTYGIVGTYILTNSDQSVEIEVTQSEAGYTVSGWDASSDLEVVATTTAGEVVLEGLFGSTSTLTLDIATEASPVTITVYAFAADGTQLIDAEIYTLID